MVRRKVGAAPAAAPAASSEPPEFSSPFKQQRYGERLSCFRRTTCVVSCLAAQGLVVGGCGLMVLGNVSTFAKRSPIVTYACWPPGECACDGRAACNVTLELSEALDPPILLMYQLESFYASHRRYKPSLSYDQLAGPGQSFSRADLEDCHPLIAPPAESLAPYSPCGLRAATMFDDAVAMLDTEGLAVNLSKQTIAATWPLADEDVRLKFANFPNRTAAQLSPLLAHPNLANTTLGREAAQAAAAAHGYGAGGVHLGWSAAEVDPQADFMSWMRGAPHSLVRKPLALIERRLPAGRYTLHVRSNYPAALFHGSKSLLLGTWGPLGADHGALAAYCLVLMAASLLMAAVLLLARKASKLEARCEAMLAVNAAHDAAREAAREAERRAIELAEERACEEARRKRLREEEEARRAEEARLAEENREANQLREAWKRNEELRVARELGEIDDEPAPPPTPAPPPAVATPASAAAPAAAATPAAAAAPAAAPASDAAADAAPAVDAPPAVAVPPDSPPGQSGRREKGQGRSRGGSAASRAEGGASARAGGGDKSRRPRSGSGGDEGGGGSGGGGRDPSPSGVSPSGGGRRRRTTRTAAEGGAAEESVSVKDAAAKDADNPVDKWRAGRERSSRSDPRAPDASAQTPSPEGRRRARDKRGGGSARGERSVKSPGAAPDSGGEDRAEPCANHRERHHSRSRGESRGGDGDSPNVVHRERSRSGERGEGSSRRSGASPPGGRKRSSSGGNGERQRDRRATPEPELESQSEPEADAAAEPVDATKEASRRRRKQRAKDWGSRVDEALNA